MRRFMLIPSILIILSISIIGLAPGTHASEEAEIPPIPTPKFEDSGMGEDYARGVELLVEQNYKAADRIFRKLRKSAPEGEQREAAERCYQEAQGGIAADKISSLIQKGSWRKAISSAEKVMDRFEGTISGKTLRDLHDVCVKELYFVIDDFEEKKQKDEDESDGGGDGRGARWRGASGYGLNTKVLKGSRKDGTVREGEHSLEWRTGSDFSYISFDDLSGKVTKEYRYLNISVRAKDSKKAPQLRILLDCEEGGLGWGGGGDGGGRGGRGGRRGGARTLNRTGFHSAISTSGKWQDFRLDLSKFKPAGDAALGDILALRIIHQGGSDGRVLIDNIRLERK
ncbi:MAG: hypothetical protein O7H41_05995 [Planctomycetota bacterium]|nr:hypothetical protein [Planctomycetota bacterium]